MLSVLLSLASTVCACLPMFGFLALVWWLDRYDREPVWLIGLTFLWGAIGGVVSAVVGSTVLQLLLGVVFSVVELTTGLPTAGWIEPAGPVLVAPVVEEPAKAAFLLYVIWNRHFDNMTDGFVYGAAAGLGFGMTENLLYFVGVADDALAWGMTVLVRTFYSALMHATATSIVGAALGFARFRGRLALLLALVAGLLTAGAVHATWNGLLTLAELTGGSWATVLDYVLFPVELAGVFLVFQICLLEESWTIKRELQEEARAGLIPADHPGILASAIRRLFGGWVPAGVDHGLYVQTATSLAMRKRQVRQMGARAPEFYRDEVDRLRRQLETLLTPRSSPGARGSAGRPGATAGARPPPPPA